MLGSRNDAWNVNFLLLLSAQGICHSRLGMLFCLSASARLVNKSLGARLQRGLLALGLASRAKSLLHRWGTLRCASTGTCVFDRQVKYLQRQWAAKEADFSEYEYLRSEVAKRLCERLLDFRCSFRRVLDVGAGASYVRRSLVGNKIVSGLELLLEVELSSAMLEHGLERLPLSETPFRTTQLTADEELFLPALWQGGYLEKAPFDLAISCMAMHWINDLPGMLAQVRAALLPGGVFLGAMLGGETLHELRVSLQLAEDSLLGGVGIHTSPMVEFQDTARLLTRVGFEMITIDVDTMIVPYPDMMTLIKHLQKMAESNALAGRQSWLSRKVLQQASKIYRERFSLPNMQIENARGDGQVSVSDHYNDWIGATFQVVYMVGWVPT